MFTEDAVKKKKPTSKSEVYSDASLPQETRKISNKQSKLSSKENTRKRTNSRKS